MRKACVGVRSGDHADIVTSAVSKTIIKRKRNNSFGSPSSPNLRGRNVWRLRHRMKQIARSHIVLKLMKYHHFGRLPFKINAKPMTYGYFLRAGQQLLRASASVHLPAGICPWAYARGHMPAGICPRAYAPGHMPLGICPRTHNFGPTGAAALFHQ